MKCVLETASRIVVLTLALCCSIIPLSALGAELDVKIEQRKVTASGVVPGARVLFYSIGLATNGYDTSVRRWSTIVPDDDRNGSATLETATDVPWKSIWVVVDLKNNHYAVATPAQFPLRLVELRSNAFRKSSPNTVADFLSDRAFVDAMYVSANGGAWTATALDGYDSDADHSVDGRVSLPLSQMQPVDGGNDKALDFSPAGLFFAIDISRMDVLAVRLNAAMLAGAR